MPAAATASAGRALGPTPSGGLSEQAARRTATAATRQFPLREACGAEHGDAPGLAGPRPLLPHPPRLGWRDRRRSRAGARGSRPPIRCCCRFPPSACCCPSCWACCPWRRAMPLETRPGEASGPVMAGRRGEAKRRAILRAIPAPPPKVKIARAGRAWARPSLVCAHLPPSPPTTSRPHTT